MKNNQKLDHRKLHKEYHDDFGSDYHYRKLRRYSEIIKPYTGLVIDVGCGDGSISNLLPENLKYIGIDFDDNYLSVIWKGRKKDRILADVTRLPFKEGVADICINHQVIEHLFQEEQSKLVYELFRTLKKNGILILSTPNIDTLIHSERFKCDPRHVSCLNYDKLKKLLLDAGFNNIKRLGFDLFNEYPHPFFRHVPYSIRRFLASNFLYLDKHLIIMTDK